MLINVTEWSSIFDSSRIISDPSHGWTYNIPNVSVSSISDVVRLNILDEYGGI